MVWISILAVVWAIGFFYSYGFVFNDYDNRVWFSVFWPCMLPLWVIHKINNRK